MSIGNRLCERRGGAKRCVKQADGWPDSVLIMATLVCREATLCSRSMGAEEWRIVMTRAPCPGTRSPFKDVEIFNMSSVICPRPLYPSSNFKKFICVTEAVIMGHKRCFLFYSKLAGFTVRVVRGLNLRYYNQHLL